MKEKKGGKKEGKRKKGKGDSLVCMVLSGGN